MNEVNLRFGVSFNTVVSVIALHYDLERPGFAIEGSVSSQMHANRFICAPGTIGKIKQPAAQNEREAEDELGFHGRALVSLRMALVFSIS
jgi:hypothetical protein